MIALDEATKGTRNLFVRQHTLSPYFTWVFNLDAFLTMNPSDVSNSTVV
eukprot:COSAG01_NODE_51823_length_351_cov_1.630952_1_plen_48_part_10